MDIAFCQFRFHLIDKYFNISVVSIATSISCYSKSPCGEYGSYTFEEYVVFMPVTLN